MTENTWCVYRHTFPNGKVYIGVTGQSPEDRWGNGMAYQSNKKMFFDIVQFGWKNIIHELLFTGLTEDEAKSKERELIKAFGKEARNKTYNSAHADYERPKQDVCTGWIDEIVTAQSVERYRGRFNMLDDSWLDPYIEQMQAYPFNVHLTSRGVEIPFYTCKDKQLTLRMLFAEYPREGMTFHEVWEWLNTAPETELIVNRTSPLDERFYQYC